LIVDLKKKKIVNFQTEEITLFEIVFRQGVGSTNSQFLHKVAKLTQERMV